MQMKLKNNKITSLLFCMMLIVAMAFCTTGCNGKTSTKNQATTAPTQNVQTENTVLGEGQTTFPFIVVDKDGNETQFEIHTDKETVGEALLEHGLIEGEEGDYGLYVKTVNGITADYDVDQTYWAFYVNDKYAQNSVDLTKITAGESYSFKVEK